MDVPGAWAAHYGSSLMSWECAFPGLWSAQSKESSTTGTRKNRVPSATIIHPSYQQRGHQGHMSCSLRIFFDVVGNVTFPGLWSAQSYGSSTTGTRETRHHRQRSSIHHIITRAPGRTSCSPRFFFDVMESIAPLVCGMLRAKDLRLTPGRTGYHRQWSSIHHIITGAPGRTSCSPRFFFDVMGNVAFPGSWSAQSLIIFIPLDIISFLCIFPTHSHTFPHVPTFIIFIIYWY